MNDLRRSWKRGLLAVTLVLAGGSARADLVDGIAAVVNDDIITFTEVRNMVGHAEEVLRGSFPPGDPALVDKLKVVRQDALDQLIERQLIIQQFNAKGGKVPDSLIEEDIRAIIDDQYGRDRSVFIRTLEAVGLNLETYKERIRDKIIVRYMQQTEVTNEIIISPYKIETYFKEHPKEFHEGEKVKLRLIFLRKSENPGEVDGTRSLAQELLVKLDTGTDFATLAKIYSEGSQAKNGGDFGYVTRDDLREQLREVAFSLKPGQISKPIETQDGFHILQVQEKTSAKARTLAEARDDVERLLMQQERERLQKRWVQTLKRSAYIRTY